MPSDATRDESTIRARLDAEDWNATYAKLRAFAASRCRSDALGADLANEAMARIYAPDCTWDPAKEPNLLRYLMSVVNSLRINELTSAAMQRNVSLDQVRRAATRVRDEAAPADEALSREQLYAQKLGRLRARLAADDDAMRVLDLRLEGVDAVAEIARLGGLPPRRAVAARLRVHRHAAAVAREFGDDDDIALPRNEDDADREGDEEVA